MARERWLIDGWELTEGLYRDVETREGMDATPSLVGENAAVANRRGSLWRPKTLGEGRFTLNGWIGATSRTGFETAWRDLLRAAFHPERLVRYERWSAAGVARECYGEVTGTLAPRAIGQLAARFALEVTVPDGVWQGVADVSDSGPTPPTDGAVFTLTNLGVSTAGLDATKIEFTGPITSPRIEIPTLAGEWVQYTGTVPAGSTMTIDCAAWSVSGTAGFTPNPAAITHGGSGSFLTIPPPTVGGVTQVRFKGTNLAAASRVRIYGRPLFLI